MRTIVVTGASSGIGRATRERLVRDGARVIGVDLRDADVTADLATAPGRAAAIAGVQRACDGVLDGLVACAGLGPQVPNAELIVSVNYFGAVATLDGLREALARGTNAAAVAVSSNSATVPGVEHAAPIVEACLADDEAAARAAASGQIGSMAYAGSKLALARWVRRQAPTATWAGAGIRLNAVAPGAVQTPLLQAGLDHELFGPAIRGFPIPTGGFGTPEQIAGVIAFLLSEDARFCSGTVLFSDGGTDALLRGDVF